MHKNSQIIEDSNNNILITENNSIKPSIKYQSQKENFSQPNNDISLKTSQNCVIANNCDINITDRIFKSQAAASVKLFDKFPNKSQKINNNMLDEFSLESNNRMLDNKYQTQSNTMNVSGTFDKKTEPP